MLFLISSREIIQTLGLNTQSLQRNQSIKIKSFLFYQIAQGFLGELRKCKTVEIRPLTLDYLANLLLLELDQTFRTHRSSAKLFGW